MRPQPESATAMLRRCTALATRARVELLSPHHRPATAELTALLAEMEGWGEAGADDPDPTMIVLAAAALQDLAERLGEPGAEGLAVGVHEVLDVLHGMMAGRIDATA
ncbi:hypothetical protein DXU92_12425 [Brachybacterium saurashtrense]|uniref:Uncharacterized protein n=1 Tax=Brachybacterium saurashtrense TaxID=556288 RepID=A0A345YMK1_9MICO|nr:hypothetical protein DWV08_05650 [Brachybacterium saurashtrense]RRR22094.1 hypothetical protein DXU92_12425 [Brachybacterium saurashtrense]